MTALNSPIPPNGGRGVVAIVGPTNTGKTHLAIERMVAHESGLIGLPLRLLAREVYNRVVEKVGVNNVALITGEEKIIPASSARFQVCTVEAMPDRTDAAFVAIDEVQLAADLERGHIFTDRLLNLRGRQETMLLGAQTMGRLLHDLLPGISIVTRPRMSVLRWAGQKKITRLPRRSAVIAFSAEEVYAIAELLRRQRGGAAVVMGSLSPRTRNAQVELYQSGEVDFLVATDAIGMGLNLDLDHVAFAFDRKFDGFSHRRLHPAEIGQIAGRAGRHLRDGTFGVTGQTPPFEDDLIRRLEAHDFEPVKVLTWRNRRLEFGSIEALKAALDMPSSNPMLMKSFPASDRNALENLSRDEEIARLCGDEAAVQLLWDVCQIPDYRRISPAEHAHLLGRVFVDLARNGHIAEDWFAEQVERSDHIHGEIDALSARIAHVRTWTYISNRSAWLSNPDYWQERTRQIEDRLSDALHDSLTSRFIDRKTSTLMKRLRENALLDAEIGAAGDVVVEGHNVGRLQGFRFAAADGGSQAKTANSVAAKVLAAEITRRAERLNAAPNGDIALGSDGVLRWLGDPVAKLAIGESVLKPRLILLADDILAGIHRDLAFGRLERWLANHIAELLAPLVNLAADNSLDGLARGLAFRLVENLGVIDRRPIAQELEELGQDARASLRRHGVRFGAYHVFIPALIKPQPAALKCLLWALAGDRMDSPGLLEIPQLAAAGRTSAPFNLEFDPEIYRIAGFRPLGPRAVRIDILERLADLIRPALAWRSESGTQPPPGATVRRAFYVTPTMMSLLGMTHENMASVLSELGYRSQAVSAEEFASILPPNISPPAHRADAGKPGAEEAQPSEKQAEETGTTASNISADSADGPGENDPRSSREILLWRPAGGNRDSRRQPDRERKPGTGVRRRKDDVRRPESDKMRAARPHKPRRQKPDPHRPRGPGPAERPIDPDSPFAQLMSLRKDLEKRDG